MKGFQAGKLRNTNRVEPQEIAVRIAGMISSTDLQKAYSNEAAFRQRERLIDPDQAFLSYMRCFKGVKVGVYLQQWIDMAPGRGIKSEVAKAHVRGWIDRNRAALKK